MIILLLTCPSGIILSMAQAQRNRSGRSGQAGPDQFFRQPRFLET